ncbi:lysozyme inhibitor LprI family protein [Azospirillum thermophilum]|uniref:Lysozyme inhibitor LprI-like N-terminal domain-containing protein n=1 Tax=Azospirillum thermophilum TaxID=2202148 RepID=A0A2S2CRM8_9PROT|nr:lysozyme inhibitor LprI family protein [Azospirillum thermophilum]AWK87119.1 hypothetical protein DEW08_13595 [Azospirillum thermophilum]
MRAAFVAMGLCLLAGSVPAAETAVPPVPDCSGAATPADQLICREPGLTDALKRLEAAAAALGETTDAAGREALAAAQTLWRQRRDAACPVTAADLEDAKKAKGRADCLARSLADRTAALEAQRKARLAPVSDLPVTIGEASARPLAPLPARPAALTRPVTAAAFVGRWAKADPQTRSPIDDCRTAYLEVSREMTVSIVDPRIPGLPVEARLPATLSATLPAEGAQPVPLESDGGARGTLALEAAEAPRVDRLLLRLEQPTTLGAVYVRCR